VTFGKHLYNTMIKCYSNKYEQGEIYLTQLIFSS